MWCVWVWSWSLVRGGHDPESVGSLTVKVLRLYGARIRVITFCLFITFYVSSRLTALLLLLQGEQKIPCAPVGYGVDRESRWMYSTYRYRNCWKWPHGLVTCHVCHAKCVTRGTFSLPAECRCRGISCLPGIAYYCCITDSIFYCCDVTIFLCHNINDAKIYKTRYNKHCTHKVNSHVSNQYNRGNNVSPHDP